VRETARASRHEETATPIPPWITTGRARMATAGETGVATDMSGTSD
jgi:hypothetical protein